MRKHHRIALRLVVATAMAIAFTNATIATSAAPPVATAAVATAAVATPSPSGQEVTLLLKYEAGDEFVFEQVMSQETVMQGMPSVSGTEITSTVRWKVLDVADNGDATIEVTNERVHGTVAGPTGVTSFDSASEEEPTDPTMRILAAQARISFRFVLAPNGDVVSIEGAEEMRNAALEAMPEDQRAMAAPIFASSKSTTAPSRLRILVRLMAAPALAAAT